MNVYTLQFKLFYIHHFLVHTVSQRLACGGGGANCGVWLKACLRVRGVAEHTARHFVKF